MRHWPLFLLLLAGCKTVWMQHTISPAPPPLLRSSNRPVEGLPSNRVLVLSPLSVEQVTSDVAGRAGAGQPQSAQDVAQGALHSADYNEAVSVAEVALLNKGWRPISQGILAHAAAQEKISGGLKDLRAGGLSWLQIALLLGKATGADSVFIIRAVEVKTDTLPVLHCIDNDARSILSFTVAVDAALVRADTGSVEWAGNMQVRSGNFLAQPITVDRTEETSCRMRSADPAIKDYYCVHSPSLFGGGGDACKRPHKLSPFIEKAVSNLVAKLTSLAPRIPRS